MMDRTKAETMILDKLYEIERIWHEYDPDGDYLSMCISFNEDGNGNESGDWDIMDFSVNNAYWGRDGATPINAQGWIDLPGEKYDRCHHEAGDKPGRFWRMGSYKEEIESANDCTKNALTNSGEWLWDRPHHFMCSVCGRVGGVSIAMYKYCPYCGSVMVLRAEERKKEWND